MSDDNPELSKRDPVAAAIASLRRAIDALEVAQAEGAVIEGRDLYVLRASVRWVERKAAALEVRSEGGA